VNSDSMDLFSIETNVGYRKTRITSTQLTRIIKQFLIEDINGIFMINKPSSDSVVYEVNSSEGFYILRGENKNAKRRVVVQCKIARMEGGQFLPQPLDNRKGLNTVTDGSRIWYAYKKICGYIYDGQNGNIQDVLSNYLSLNRRLDQINDGLRSPDISSLIVKVHHREKTCREIMGAMRWIISQKEQYGDVKDILLKHKRQLKKYIRVLPSLGARRKRLIHNDANHSNIIIGRGVSFVDLEDICYEDPRFCVSHCLFKMSRHKVFKGHPLGLVRREVQDIFKMKEFINIVATPKEACLILERKYLEEIAVILSFVKHQKDVRYVYDLEKKIHNIYEAKKLFL
jgi:hypothetical protein